MRLCHGVLGSPACLPGQVDEGPQLFLPKATEAGPAASEPSLPREGSWAQLTLGADKQATLPHQNGS